MWVVDIQYDVVDASLPHSLPEKEHLHRLHPDHAQ